MTTRRFLHKSKRAYRPVCDDLEGRQLMSVVHPLALRPSAPAVVHVSHHRQIAPHGPQARDHRSVQNVQHTRPAEVHHAATPTKATYPNSPAIVAFDGKLYRATTEAQGKTRKEIDIQCSSDVGKTWTEQSKVPETSEFDPALTVFNGRLYLAWTGTDAEHHINIESSSDGVHWGDQSTLADTAFSAPTLAVSDGRLYMAWAGTDQDNHINIASTFDGTTFDRKVTLAETTARGASIGITPGLAGGIAIAWSGRGKTPFINFASSADGMTFGPAKTLVDASPPEGRDYYTVGPSMAVYGGRYVIAFVDTRFHVNLLWSDGEERPNWLTGSTYPQTIRKGTVPELAVLDGLGYMAFTGSDGAYHTVPIR